MQGSAPTNRAPTIGWCDSTFSPETKSLIVTVALVAIAAVIAYFATVNGLELWDTAVTTLEQVKAGILIYTGVSFAFVGVGNAVYTGGKLLCCGGCEEGGEFEYSNKEMKYQIGLSVLAPITAIPSILLAGLALAGLKR